jgi:hypothetical protein
MVQVAAVLLWFSPSRCTGDVCSRAQEWQAAAAGLANTRLHAQLMLTCYA